MLIDWLVGIIENTYQGGEQEGNSAPPEVRGAGGVSGQGLLVFEKNDGSPDIVTAKQIAQNLADCRVPIFVLNAIST